MAVLESIESAVPATPDILVLRTVSVLPEEGPPEMVICRTSDGRWMVADRQGLRPLQPGTELQFRGRLWRFRDAEPPSARLRFEVSQDEEHVRLELAAAGARIDFGERAHHQSLLLLARERHHDEHRGVRPAECGWRDMASLERMLGIDVMHINTHVFRARRQIERALRARTIALPLVERRSHQLRFGPLQFQVDPLGAAPMCHRLSWRHDEHLPTLTSRR